MVAQNKNILALDLGTQMGWATACGSLVTSGTKSFKPGRYEGGGMRYLSFIRFLGDIQKNLHHVDAVFFEEVRRHKGVDAAHVYGGFLAHLSTWCEQQNIPYKGIPVGTIKKHATGKGNANKDAMMAAAVARGHKPEDDNEADALALLDHVLETEVA